MREAKQTAAVTIIHKLSLKDEAATGFYDQGMIGTRKE